MIENKEKDFYDHKDTNWGYPNFIPWKDVIDPEKGYIKDDMITLEVLFIVFVA